MRINWFFIWLAYGGLFVYGLVDNARGPIFPDILTTFQLDDFRGSIFFFLSSLAGTLANATAFLWLKRWPTLVSFRFFAGLQAAALLMIAFSGNYPLVLAGAFLFGFSMGGLGLLVNVLTAQATVGELRRRAMSGLHAMYGGSSLLAPLFVTIFYANGGSWRTVLAVFSILPFMVGLASFYRHRPGVFADSEVKPSRGSVSFKQAWPYVLMIGFYVIAECLVGTRLVLYTRRELGYSSEDANYLLSGFFLMLFAGRMMFAFFTFKTTTHRLLLISAISGFAFYLVGLFVHPAGFVGCGLSFSFFYPCAMADISDRLGPERAPVVMSWVQMFQALGLLGMHFAVGVISDWAGLSRAMWVGVFALAIVIVSLKMQVSLGETASQDDP